MPDLRSRIIRLAYDNPKMQSILLPVLAAQEKVALSPDTEKFVLWAMTRAEKKSASAAQSFLEKFLGREPTQPSEQAKPKRGPLGVDEWVRVDKYKNTNDLNTAAARLFHDQYGKVDAISSEGVTVTFQSGASGFFNGFTSGQKSGLYRGAPKVEVSDQMTGTKKMLELVYITRGQSVPSRRDTEALAEYVHRGVVRGEERSMVYYTGPVVKFAVSKAGQTYFAMMAQQRSRPFTSVNPTKGEVLYIGRLGSRPGGWRGDAMQMGITF